MLNYMYLAILRLSQEYNDVWSVKPLIIPFHWPDFIGTLVCQSLYLIVLITILYQLLEVRVFFLRELPGLLSCTLL